LVYVLATMAAREGKPRQSHRPSLLPVLAGLALALLAGCGPSKTPVRNPRSAPLCRINTSLNADKPLVQRDLPAPFWYSLMVRGYQATGDIPRPSQDCTGQLIAWTADQCAIESDSRTTVPAALTERDIVVDHLGEGRRLVWVLTERYVNGEAMGPVALATFDSRGVAVDVVGVLRAYPGHVHLRLERLGEYQLLVAEGEACSDEHDSHSCTQAVRIVPVGNRRFIPLDLADVQGHCMGRTFFPLRSEGSIGDGNNRRTYRLQRSINFNPDAVLVQEQMQVMAGSWGAESADAKSSVVSRMTVDRRIRVIGGRLVVDEPSLLERMYRPDRIPTE
jgi:hypothetical protein